MVATDKIYFIKDFIRAYSHSMTLSRDKLMTAHDMTNTFYMCTTFSPKAYLHGMTLSHVKVVPCK